MVAYRELALLFWSAGLEKHMTSDLPAPHSSLLERVRDAVDSDNCLSALLIGGSYVHGGLDDHSDLDFVVVVEQDDYVMETRVEFAASIGDMVEVSPRRDRKIMTEEFPFTAFSRPEHHPVR